MPSHPSMPTVRGSTELMFVVADPVAQVKAPEALNLVFALAGVDAVVLPARVAAAHLGGFVRETLAVGNVRGLSVSIPHKTPLMGLLDRFDACSQAAGAVNAVRRAEDGALEGALFDGAGFVAALKHHGVNPADRRALIVGAGGAGLAIAAALADCRLASLTVVDADADRAATLVRRIAALAPYPVRQAPSSDPAGHDLVIQATPLGLRPGDPLPLDPQRLQQGSTVIDILMTRQDTPLVQACHARGIAAHLGHEMMVQQIPAYLAYFGYPELADALQGPRADWLDQVRLQMQGPAA